MLPELTKHNGDADLVEGEIFDENYPETIEEARASAIYHKKVIVLSILENRCQEGEVMDYFVFSSNHKRENFMTVINNEYLK